MSQNIAILTLTLVATAVVRACRFTTFAGAESGANGDIFGVSQSAAAIGEAYAVDCIGTALVEAGAAFAAGDYLASDSQGRAIKASAGGITTAVVAGAAAGNVTVAGITTDDRLVAVIRLDRDATAANVNLAQLTSEFTISAANTITNTGGTNTTGDSLLVIYERAHRPAKARALQAASGAGVKVEAFLLPAA